MKLVRRLHPILKAVVVLTFTAASMLADVVYNFSGTGTDPTEAVGFQLTVPDFLTLPASFTCSQLDSSTNCFPQFFPSIFFSDTGVGPFSAQLQFDASNGVGYIFDFPTGAFDALGVFNTDPSDSNSGTLTVTQVTTPEPAAVLLALTAICFCGLRMFTARRRANARPPGTAAN